MTKAYAQTKGENKLFHIMNSKSRLLLLFMSLVFINAFGQKHNLSNLVNLMTKEACSCFATSGSHNFDSLDTDIMPACFFNFMRTNEKLLIETAKNVYGDTSDIAGKKLAVETFNLVSSKLVYDCDIFYNALIEDRKAYYKKYYQLDKDSIKAILETKNKVSKSFRDAKYYHLRGCDYFNLQEYSKAANDFDSAEVLDENFFDINIYYKAQIAEILGKYDEAIIEYEIFAKDKNWYLFHLYGDMLRRKRGGKKYNPSFLSNLR